MWRFLSYLIYACTHARARARAKLEKNRHTVTKTYFLHLFLNPGKDIKFQPSQNHHQTVTKPSPNRHQTVTSYQLVIHLSHSRSSQDPVDTTAWTLTSCKSSSQYQEHPDTHSLDSGGYFQSWINLPLTKQNRLKHCFWACRVGSIYLETWTLQTPLSVELICTRLSDMLIPAEPGHADPLGI